ncbi:hypothetical protein AVEN_74708-1 [Araneus ventricosus]|uniref:Uncharacterized protein n=1 Tax=Araneus ventricosus TaxID=182803 RepID=A0A4Y2J7X3_ARAVE|nr:hypothetical protein AVEN_74708-1 [Araneus ventricosus]
MLDIQHSNRQTLSLRCWPASRQFFLAQFYVPSPNTVLDVQYAFYCSLALASPEKERLSTQGLRHFNYVPSKFFNLHQRLRFEHSRKLVATLFHCVTNMECRFPAMQVLWLGTEFYKVKHGVTSATVMAP